MATSLGEDITSEEVTTSVGTSSQVSGEGTTSAYSESLTSEVASEGGMTPETASEGETEQFSEEWIRSHPVIGPIVKNMLSYILNRIPPEYREGISTDAILKFLIQTTTEFHQWINDTLEYGREWGLKKAEILQFHFVKTIKKNPQLCKQLLTKFGSKSGLRFAASTSVTVIAKKFAKEGAKKCAKEGAKKLTTAAIKKSVKSACSMCSGPVGIGADAAQVSAIKSYWYANLFISFL